MTKEEPLIRQIARSRALKSHRDGSASPIRRMSKGGVAANHPRSISQPPLRASTPTTVYTLQILPYSFVYPQALPRPRISLNSVSQPDLTKMATPISSRFTTPPSTANVSRCVSPFAMVSSQNSSRCGSPASLMSQTSVSREATPPIGGRYGSLIDTNNNENFCQCPDRQGQQTCFSSLCCEICKLFPPSHNNSNQVTSPILNRIQPQQQNANINDNNLSDYNKIR